MKGLGVAALLLFLMVTPGCSTAPSTAHDRTGTPVATPAGAPSRKPPPSATPRLDSIAVIGHSGATGTLSDPANVQRDATENSWATGDNPAVQSIYTRLAATHPALKGHGYNAAVNGSRVDDLSAQIDQVLRIARIQPDLVLVQTIDNDMRCDGTDSANVRAFGTTLDQALSKIDRTMPGARVYLTSQWATVAVWTRWARHLPSQVADNQGTGPCDVFDERGNPRQAGITSLQRVVDDYWAEVERVCGLHPGCATDGGAEQREFVPSDADVAIDHNHLSVAGHAKYAAIAWKALPDAIKQAP
jgi:hypothetical protein